MEINCKMKAIDAFGFHSSDQVKKWYTVDEYKNFGTTLPHPDSLAPSQSRFKNVTTALGYIPVVGTIIGIARIAIFAYCLKNEKKMDVAFDKNFSKANIARGSVEALSLGWIFLIPDIIVTIGRNLPF